jgi:hypothetical protein
LSSFFEAMQLTPPGSPFAHKIGGADEGSSPAANVFVVSDAATSPIAIMNAVHRIFT